MPHSRELAPFALGTLGSTTIEGHIHWSLAIDFSVILPNGPVNGLPSQARRYDQPTSAAAAQTPRATAKQPRSESLLGNLELHVE